MFGRALLGVLLSFSLLGSAAAREGDELLGTRAPAFSLQHWVNSAPLEIGDLQGKVVLVRWFTDTCPFCAATAPALRKLQDEYGSSGFQVIGVFHPKPAGNWNPDRVQQAVARFAFTFPVAEDGDWSALKRWWLNSGSRQYTSVSFLIDKHGVIRYIHPGGEYHEGNCTAGQEHCQADFKMIEKTISDLLAEK